MHITQVQSYCNQPSSSSDKLNFRANPKSPKLKFHNDDFFIHIEGYGKNKDWADIIKRTADQTIKLILDNKSFDKVLKKIVIGVKNANGFCSDYRKRTHTGIIRTDRKGYGKTGEWKNIELVTPVAKPYDRYEKKLTPIVDKPLKSPFEDIETIKIEKGNWIDYDLRIVHPDGKFVNNALDRVGNKYSDLKHNYISTPEKVTTKTLPQINSDIAEIRWIMAHSMPWERGSDAISNVFIRTLYKSMGIKSYPLKKGISLDLQAFCTPLEQYKKEFPKYFEKAPKIVE